MTSMIKVKATIPISTTTSDEINFTHSIPQAIVFPAAMTGATVTFTNAAESGGTFVPVINSTVSAAATSTTTYAITVTASRQIPIDPYVARSLAFAKVVSASSEAAARDIVFICREGNSVA